MGQATATEGVGGLLLKDAQLPKHARITAFEIHLVSANFLSMEEFPTGWHISLDNTPGGESTLEAHANPGARPIDERVFHELDLEITVHDLLAKPFDVWAVFTVTPTEEQKHTQLNFSSYSFNFVARSPRRVLPSVR
jgi:hypothetical protein